MSVLSVSRCGVMALAWFLLRTAPVLAQDFLIPPALYAVQGAPFEAMVENRWEGNATKSPGRNVSRIVHDSAGRQRFEMPALDEAAVTGVEAQVMIYDVVRERIIQLDTARKTATVTAMSHLGRGVTIDPAVRRGFPCKAVPGGESLGVKWIAGYETCGQRLPGRELWLSTSYQMPLMAVKIDRKLGKVTEQVTQLRTGEPDASLFEVPAGYSVVQH